jgi:hypothetical protein
MILNKSSFERGFAHGTVYSTEFVELNEKSFGSGRNTKIFQLDPKLSSLKDTLDSDGLPFVGSTIKPGDPYYWLKKKLFFSLILVLILLLFLVIWTLILESIELKILKSKKKLILNQYVCLVMTMETSK